MSSQSAQRILTSTAKELEVLETKTWTDLVVMLDSQASGISELQVGGGEFTEVEPGASIRLLLAPSTTIRLRTSSSADVRWAIYSTQVDIIDTFLAVLCQLGGNR